MSATGGKQAACTCGRDDRRGPLHEHSCPVFLTWSHRPTVSARAAAAGRERAPRSPTEWAVLDTLRGHLYDYRSRGSKPDDPGWHPCSCGWEGYWCDWQPHVAEQIVAALPAPAAAGQVRPPDTAADEPDTHRAPQHGRTDHS